MALDRRHREIIEQGDQLLGKRGSLLSLHQEIADHFYPERADFTTVRSLGQDFAANLTTSYPIIARRTLGNILSAMLRPQGEDWANIRAAQEEREDNAAKRWLEWASKTMKRAMYDRVTNFVRSTKEADHDWAAFGQAVLHVGMNGRRDALNYRTYHLRDVAWCENSEGHIDTIHRRWKPTKRELMNLFSKKPGCSLASAVTTNVSKEPYSEVNCRHVIFPTENYEAPAGGKKWRTPYVSLYIDIDNQHVIEETPVNHKGYVIPRWQTVSGSQYAYSPCVVAALPDARLIQAMTLALLDAGERAARPPLIAVRDAIRSDVNDYPAGVTWVDAEYDEQLGEVLRPIRSDKTGIPIVLEMLQDTREMISSAFFLDKIALPPPDKSMTAYEVSQRMSEWIRAAAPLFEPVEADYNGQLCEETFQILLREGTFGSPNDIPDSLKGQDVQFRFVSPLAAASDKGKMVQFQQAGELLAAAAAIDPASVAMFDAKTALRDALTANHPAKWIRPEEETAAIIEQMAKANAAQAAAAAVGTGAQVVEQVGKAGQAMNEAAGAVA